MFLSIGMLKQKYFLTDIFILSAEKQPIKLSWRKIEWLQAIGADKQEIRESFFIGRQSYQLFFQRQSEHHVGRNGQTGSIFCRFG